MMTDLKALLASLAESGFREILSEPYNLNIVGPFIGFYRIYARPDMGLLADFSSLDGDRRINSGHIRGEIIIPRRNTPAYEKFTRMVVGGYESQFLDRGVDVFSADIRYTDPGELIRRVEKAVGTTFASPWRNPRSHHLWLESPADKDGILDRYDVVVSAIQRATARRLAAFPSDVRAFMTIGTLLE